MNTASNSVFVRKTNTVGLFSMQMNGISMFFDYVEEHDDGDISLIKCGERVAVINGITPKSFRVEFIKRYQEQKSRHYLSDQEARTLAEVSHVS